jgi:hypothetical protein
MGEQTTIHFDVVLNVKIITLVIEDWLISLLIIIALYRVKSDFYHTKVIIRRCMITAAEAQVLPSLV